MEDDINESANTTKNLETVGSIFTNQEIEMEEFKDKSSLLGDDFD